VHPSNTSNHTHRPAVKNQTTQKSKQKVAKSTKDGRTKSGKLTRIQLRRETTVRAPITGETTSEQVLALFEVHSANRQAFEVLRPDLPAIFRTLVAGAKIPGHAGNQDRQTILRILGAPWTLGASDKSERAQNLDELTNRIVKAIATREQRMVGRTIEAELVEDAPPPVAPSVEPSGMGD
jgi:hypothetical protein